jgi:CxxC motif-containing protein
VSDRQDARSAAQTWEHEEGVTCVVCPTCAFTFDASHADADGGYSCPVCAEAPMARVAHAARIYQLERAGGVPAMEREAFRSRARGSVPRKEIVMARECGIGKCKRFGQKPRLGLWLHNLIFHFGK